MYIAWIVLASAVCITVESHRNSHIELRSLGGNVLVPKKGIRTIGDLRQTLERKYKAPVELYRQGTPLNNAESVDYDNAKIDVMVTLRGGMRVQVQTMMGQKLEVEVDPNETVLEFKKKLSKKQKLPVDQQRIIYEGKMLQDNKTLADYNIKNNSVIHMVLRLRGGHE
ncbi:ubiquitin [Babesia ovis]|uniref:Ubiquitin n=1 Tax=Babesia ovis TaxID=5869 RepID=A0A9W5WVK8_BABOV|nr:ubiquitin [Babesia ovis]